GLLVKPLVFSVSNSMQQKMLSLLPTRILLPPILACVSWLYKPRKTGQLLKNVGESPLRRCILIDINSIHPARTLFICFIGPWVVCVSSRGRPRCQGRGV